MAVVSKTEECRRTASWREEIVECQRPVGHLGRCAALWGREPQFWVLRWLYATPVAEGAQ